MESSSFGAFFATMVISNSILIGVSLEAQAVQRDHFAGVKTAGNLGDFTKVPYQVYQTGVRPTRADAIQSSASLGPVDVGCFEEDWYRNFYVIGRLQPYDIDVDETDVPDFCT